MSASRRDLLKFFGIGTVIAPVIGAAPLARLIEVPKVELIEPAALIVKAVSLGNVESFDVTLNLRDGSRETFHATTKASSGFAIRGDIIDIHFGRVVPHSPSWTENKGNLSGDM